MRFVETAGGQTIREINQKSGARCWFPGDRLQQTDIYKTINIEGTPVQVETAIQLIKEKTGQVYFIKIYYLNSTVSSLTSLLLFLIAAPLTNLLNYT
jgi:hypothetical protein